MSPFAIACLVTLGSSLLGGLFFLAYQWGAHDEWHRGQEQREAIEDLEAEDDVMLADLRLSDEPTLDGFENHMRNCASNDPPEAA